MKLWLESAMITIFVGLVVISLRFLVLPAIGATEFPQKRETSSELSFDSLTISSIWPIWEEKLTDEGVKFPRIFFVQMILETGYLKSPIKKGNNNLVGMKRNSRGLCLNPPGKACPENICYDCVHACYESELHCVKDYAQWQAIRLSVYEAHYKKRVTTEADYFDFLDNIVIGGKPGYRYAEDPTYTDKLKSILSTLELPRPLE
jgi:hypothetical protein